MVGESRRVGNVAVVVAAVALAGAWVVVHHPLEGPVLVSLTANHGVHDSDALAIIPLACAWWWVRRR